MYNMLTRQIIFFINFSIVIECIIASDDLNKAIEFGDFIHLP